jgi:hypothetical protein
MALIAGIGFFLMSVLVAVFSKLLAEEIGAWSPSVIRSLIKLAVARLPKNKRERFEEEWQSHVNDVPGHLGKLLVAVGFLKAAYKVALSEGRNHMLEVLESSVAKVDEVISITTKLVSAVQNDESLISLQGISSTDERRPMVENVVVGLKEVELELSKAKTSRDRLVKLIAAASTHPRSSTGNLASILLFRAKIGKLHEQLSQQAEEIKERGTACLKLIEKNKKLRR